MARLFDQVRRSFALYAVRVIGVLAILAALISVRPPGPGYSAPAANGPFTGVWTSGPTSTEAAAMDDLGVGWARATVVWNTVEPSNGTFVWSGLDQQISTASGGGRRTVLAQVRDAPAWAAATRCTLTTPTEWQNMANFMSALAGRYKGVVWQFFNEEDNTSPAAEAQSSLGGCFATAVGGVPTTAGRINYAKVLEYTASAIRAGDPTAQIATGGVASGNFVTPSGGAFDPGFLPGVLAQLKADNNLGSLDYIAVHYYSSQAVLYASAGTDLIGRVNQMRQDIMAAGLAAGEVKPVISDELSYTDTVGSSTGDPNNAWNLAQRAYVSKLYARAAAANVRAAFWFWMQDSTSGLGSDNAYGLKDLTATVKPAYNALRYFNSIIKNQSQFVRTLPLSGVSTKLEGYEFTTTPAGSFVQIVWNQTDTTQIAYSLAGSIVSVTDPGGNAVAWSGNTISIGSEPRYITYTPPPTATPTPTLTPTLTPSPTPTATPTPVPTQTGGNLITTLSSPVRLADTRFVGGPVAGGTSRCFQVTGVGGIPGDAGGVIVNVTAVGYTSNGWLTVYPNGQGVPGTSTLNFGTTEYAMANGSTVRIGTGGQVCVNVGISGGSTSSAHVILDATGYFPSSALSQLALLPTPVRVSDTRLIGGPLPSGGTQCFQVGGIGGIPPDAAAAVLNLTAVGFTTNGWLTAFPNGQPVPGTSTLNFDQSEYAVANNSIMRIGNNGQVCVNVGTGNAGAGGSHVIIDVAGYLTSSALSKLSMLPSPQRVVDTRISSGLVNTGSSRCFPIVGQAGIPSGATGVVANFTVVGYTAQGWLTAYPSGQAVPGTSTLNFDTTEYALANGAIVALGGDGQLCVNIGTLGSAPGGTHVIVDVVGYLAH